MKFLRGRGVVSGVEGLDRLVEITIRPGLGRRFRGGLLFEFSLSFIERLAFRRVVVVIVVVRWTRNHITRRIIPVPCIGMPSIPVIASVIVVGPVTAKTNEDEFAVIVGPEEAEGETRAARVANRTTAIRPRDPVKDPV